MKTITKLFTLAAILLITGFTTNVMAQGTVTGTTAGANILEPITLTKNEVLNFGSMSVAIAIGGTCVLSTQGNRSATGGVSISPICPSATKAAFTVTGSPATATYVIMLPGTITVTNGTPAQDMLITPVARASAAVVDGTTGTLSGGSDTFTVGGTLNVAAAQPAVAYSGTFSVTVGYN